MVLESEDAVREQRKSTIVGRITLWSMTYKI